jgi:hypothetical protein
MSIFKTFYEWEKALTDLGFKKTNDEQKIVVPTVYHMGTESRRLITYEHPLRKEKIKLSISKGVIMVQTDCGKNQHTAWKSLHGIEEVRQYFGL